MRGWKTLVLTALTALFLTGCAVAEEKRTLAVWHAGSLNAPMTELAKAFMAAHPDVEIKNTSAGSVELANDIAKKGGCDVYLTADYKNIEDILKPDHADWNVQFVTNAMVLCYGKKAAHASTITPFNWYKVLETSGVKLGHTNPNLDPGGYRALLVLKLAEAYYKQPGLYQKVMDNPGRRVSDGLNKKAITKLLKWGSMDYFFMYKSSALTDGFQYIDFPVEINLADPAFAETYATASLEIKDKDGNPVTITGEPIVYGCTIPKGTKNADLAAEYLAFVLSPEGMAVLDKNGFTPLPLRSATPKEKGNIPAPVAALLAD